ncbi:hypothetical protein BDF22DRAFT_203846 [Syncephalis plumigaleata]|nr:hypothetical protein BDF22DRAFT_203846 [Syncephalis plumigaleata]
MPDEASMAKGSADYSPNSPLSNRQSGYDVNDYPRPTITDPYSDRYVQHSQQMRLQTSNYTTQSVAYSDHNAHNEYSNYSQGNHQSTSNAAPYPSSSPLSHTNHAQGRPWSPHTSTTTNANTVANTDNDTYSIHYAIQSTSAAYANIAADAAAPPLPHTSPGVNRRPIRESTHYPDRFNSRYSVASLQQLHDAHGNAIDINRQSTVSPPVSTVAFSQVSNAYSVYNTHSPTEMNAEPIANNQHYHYNQPDTDQVSTSTDYNQSCYTRPTNQYSNNSPNSNNNNNNQRQPYHRRIVSSDQLPISASISSSIASSTTSRPRHMSQGEINRPFSPISLDVIDNHLLRNGSQSTSHSTSQSSERPATTSSSAAYSTRHSTPSVNHVEHLPRHPSSASSSSSASSRPSTLFVQSIAGAASSNVPPAFPLISRSDRPSIASPVPDPSQRTLETNIDAVVGGGGGGLRQTASNDAKSSTPTNNSNSNNSISNNNEGPAISTLLVARPTSKNGKFGISMRFDRAFFCAGGLVTGRIEIQCQSSSIRLGEVSVEVIGIEEVTSDSSTNSQFNGGRRCLFYRARTLLQDANTPCDAAVRSLPPGNQMAIIVS